MKFTVIDAGQKVDPVNYYFPEWTSWSEDIRIPVDQGRTPEEVAEFWKFPKDIAFSNAHFELFFHFLFILLWSGNGVDDLDASKLEILIGVVFQVESFGPNVSMRLHEHSDALSHDDHNTGKAQILTSCKVGGNKQIQTCMAYVKWNPDESVGSESYLRDEDNAKEDKCHS